MFQEDLTARVLSYATPDWMVKNTVQQDIKPHDSMQTRPPHQPLMSTLSAEGRRVEQALQPHFCPPIRRVNSTRYLQDTKGVSMATVRNNWICTPGLRLAKTTIVVPTVIATGGPSL